MIVNPGETFGSYRIVRLLGRGGMSEVYEAVAPDGKAVAVKVFSVRRADAEFLRKRFLAEGRILSCLDHPNLVHVYEVGVEAESETPYLVTELDPGVQLDVRWRLAAHAAAVEHVMTKTAISDQSMRVYAALERGQSLREAAAAFGLSYAAVKQIKSRLDRAIAAVEKLTCR